jgi:hypothetical protein
MLRVKELLNNLLKQTKNPDLARKFVDLVIGEAGRRCSTRPVRQPRTPLASSK